MAGESPREVVIGLLKQVLARAEAGHVEGVLIGVVSPRVIKARNVISVFAAGDSDKANINNAMREICYLLGKEERHWEQWHWRRIPQVQVMP